MFEGTEGNANLGSLQAMEQATTNDNVHFYAVEGAGHFNIVEPVSTLIAAKISRDVGPTTKLAFDQDELDRPFAK